MLVLSRKKGQSIMIGEDIFITILDTSGGVVKVGVDAPRHIPVNREEIHERIKNGVQQNKNDVVESIMDRVKELMA